MAIRLNNRQRIYGGLALQLLIVLGVVLSNPEVVLLGEVISIKTAPMSPHDLRSAMGLRLDYGVQPSPAASFARFEKAGPHWQLKAFVSEQQACTNCKHIRRNNNGAWGLFHYQCTPEEAITLERELRMEAMAAGEKALPIIVEAVINDGEIVRLRRARIAGSGH